MDRPPTSVFDAVKVFVSYSHQDSRYLEKDSLLGFLRGLENEGFEFWTDRKIDAGLDRIEEIKANLQDAQIALALVSQAFLDSDDRLNREIRTLLARQIHLIPVILSPCEWERHDWLKARQCLPADGKTLEEHYTDSGAEKALFHEIRQALRKRVETIRNVAAAPAALRDYYKSRIGEWCDERYALDTRFVQLTLLLDQGEDAQGSRWAAQERKFTSLNDVLAKAPDQALVLLGPPGCGKSTLLRHFELNNARTVLEGGTGDALGKAPITFFIQLNDYRAEGGGLPEPMTWLAGRWRAKYPESRYPNLPGLDRLLEDRRLTLLLDALNEIPHAGDEAVQRWKDFLRDLNRDRPGNRVIFSCRSLDYSASLSSKDLPVPQVRIEPLSDAQVKRFVELYCPAYGEAIWSNLEGSRQLELLRSPYYLKLLVAQSREGEIPEGRAALFTGFVRQALKREVEADNPLFRPDELLDRRDCRRLINVRVWQPPWELPSEGILCAKLSTLAYGMQAQRWETPDDSPTRDTLIGKLRALAHIAWGRRDDRKATQNSRTGRKNPLKAGEASQVCIGLKDALKILAHPSRDKDILKAGEAIGVLEEDLGRDEVLYVHQLLQEYFAGRRLAKGPEPGGCEWNGE